MDSWLVIYSKAREEARAQVHLQNQGFETFSPVFYARKNRAGKAIIHTEPLFPRYVFVRCSSVPNLSTIRSTRGVAGLVKFGNELAKVPDSLITTLRHNQLALEQVPVTQLFKKGDTLAILAGPFAHLNGVFEMADGEHRSIILLKFLGQSLQLSVENTVLSRAN